MPILLFRLNGVPDDEADDVRALLAEHQIDWYETDAGRWGFSIAAIWLRDDARVAEARDLIADYQRARETRVRSEYETLRAEGRDETLFERFRSAPVRFVIYLVLIAAIIYLMLLPFTQVR
jgi:hypothetical protein